MIQWHEQPDEVLVSENKSASTQGEGFSFAFTDSSFDSHELDLDKFAQEGVGFAPFNWKGVQHLKVDGHVSALDDVVVQEPTMPDRLLDALVYSSSGLRMDNGTLVFPSEADFFYACKTRPNGKGALVLYGRAHNRRFEAVCNRIARVYNYATKKYDLWGSISGSGPTPSAVNGVKGESLSGVCSTILAIGQSDLRRDLRYTFRKPYRILSNGRERKLSEQAVRFLVNHYYSYIRSECERGFREINPTLQATAFDALQKFDGNMLALLPEIGSFGKTTIQSILDFADSPKRAKDAASLWLSNRYGDRLTKSDLSSLFSAIDTSFLTVPPKRTCRYTRTKSRDSFEIDITDFRGSVTADVKVCCQIAVAPKDYNALMKLVRAAYEWDFYPSLGNVWDMIPLSFVVDWFVNVGDIWESVDRMVQSRYYDVPAVLLSYKTEVVIPSIGGVRFSYYNRWVQHHLDLGVSSVQLGLPSAINVVDGISLLLS